MVGRRRAAAGFRPGPLTPATSIPSRRQATALLACLVVVAAAVVAAAYLVKPSHARSFHLFYGTAFINDDTGPVAIDLASGKPTVRLRDAFTSVSATNTGELSVYPLAAGGTLMLDTSTGEFNLVDGSGLVIKTTGGGVRLPTVTGSSSSTAVPSGNSAYIVQTGPAGTSVYLVDASTVDSAIGTRTPPKPRAYATLAAPMPAGPSSAVSAGGNLWLLTGTGRRHQLTKLALPAGTNAGVALHRSQPDAVSGPAALASADLGARAGTAVALASRAAVRVFAPDGTEHSVPVHVPGGVDAIESATNLQGEFAFLYHGGEGWSVVTAGASTNTAESASVHHLAAIGTGAPLARPAESGGHLYTMTLNGTGRLWQIDRDGTAETIRGAATYPLLPGEKSDLSRSTVYAQGRRVIFDSRANYEAEAVFTDGSHRPLVIDKHAAVQVDANAAADLADAGPPSSSKGPTPPKTTQTHPSQPVNDKIDCKQTTQVPHIPSVQPLQIGSRSVQLQWTYPNLDTQDCDPSTYTVSTAVLSGQAPAPPGRVTVQGQRGINLVGLFPDTEYQIVVTAYINGRGTASLPLDLRTTIEGPAAPTGLRTTVDDAGNWTVHWNSCGGISAGCVPSANWQIIPHFCDGSGLSAAPPVRDFIGDPTQHSFEYTYTGRGALLGRGLGFQVEGVGLKGTIGTAAGDHACTFSWAHPVTRDITVQASAPPITTGQSTTSTTVSVHFAKGAVHDLGGVGGTLTYQLMSDGRVVTTRGPTKATTVQLGGIRPGQTYRVRVLAAPPRHAGAAVTIGPVDVRPAIARWPVPTVTAAFADTTVATGTLVVTVAFPAGTDTRGETFDLVNSTLTCGNTAQNLSQVGIVPGQPFTVADVDRAQYNGSCQVNVQLVQDPLSATDPALYGAGPSAPAQSPPVSIDPPQLSSGQDDFAASWVSGAAPGNPQIAVTYEGSDPFMNSGFVTNWSMTAANPGDSTCGSSTNGPDATIDVSHTCVKAGGQFTVSISFRYFGVPHATTATVTGSQPAPVDTNRISFTAAWANSGPFVTVAYSGPYGDATLSALEWTETVTSSGSRGVSCAQASQAPTNESNLRMSVDLTTCPPTTVDRSGNTVASIYTVQIEFTDPNYGSTGDYSPVVTGSPQP